MKDFFKFMFASMLGLLIMSVILFFIFIGIITSVANMMEQKEAEVAENTLLKIDFTNAIIDRTSPDPFSDFDFASMETKKSIGLNDILDNLDKAARDPKIKGVYLNLTSIQSGMATIEEIRKALTDFKESGKFIFAYSDYYSQAAYYLATTADEIYVNPEGGVDFRGLSAELMFFKGTLEKLDAEMQIIRHGKYKSAVEPFMLDKMSEENREQMMAIVDGLWVRITAAISASRNIPVDDLNKFADELALNTADDALEFGFVDGLKYYDEILADLKTKLGVEEGEDIESVSLAKYTNAPDPSELTPDRKNRIAVVYAVGEIITGEGSDQIIGSSRISKAIRQAREDDKVKAIVMRVNSPGGSALASDIILREVKLAAAEKPFIVSMGNVAASGGYYISCAADKIYADPTTITGSIGVLGLVPNLEQTMKNKLGVTFDYVRTNENASMMTTNRPLTQYQKDVIMESIEDIYATFVNHVAEGRKMTYEAVDAIGQGRVWVGSDAKEIGLIDELGGLDEAIAAAVEEAALDTWSIKEYPEQKDPIEEIFNEIFGQASVEAKIKAELGDNYRLYQYMKYWQNAKGVQARLPFDIYIN
ncbi:MAG: signal peptide peptidase SppA [Bacteroidales bacterium]|nr:signal peptide peptidase SppA [Bacteroidales bacterium]